jgi:hypothetical protein
MKRLLAILLCVFAIGGAVAGEDDIRVAARPESKAAREFLPAVYRDVAARLTKLPAPLPAKPTPADVPGSNWEKLDEAQAFIKDARNVPELYARLLIPPGFPNAVAEAKTDARIRAATVLGQARDRRGIDALVNSAVYDPEESVRFVAAKALKLLEEPIAMRRLVDLAIAPDRQKFPWAIRKSACAAIRHYGDKEAVERILKELSYELAGGNALDRKNQLRGKGAGIGTDNPLAMPDPGPNQQLPETEIYPALSAIKEVTGMGFDKGEKDMKTWYVWWNREGTKFAFKD